MPFAKLLKTIETGAELQLQFVIPEAGMDRKFGVVGRAIRVWEGLLKGKAVLFSGIQFVKDYDAADEQALV